MEEERREQEMEEGKHTHTNTHTHILPHRFFFKKKKQRLHTFVNTWKEITVGFFGENSCVLDSTFENKC